ncbi:MAG TPA: hypothetical protein VGF76_00820 [Polyangiaceae bacterium]
MGLAASNKRAGVVLAWVIGMLTLGEYRLFERLLFQDRGEYEFVLSGVSGVLSGRPVSQSWQHRFLSPLLVAALDSLTSDRFASLKLFCALLLGCANCLLFAILRRKGQSLPASLLGVACFGLAHLLLLYRLEYPWDDLDILLFLAFGYWAAQGRSLLWFCPLLVLGTLNHETALFVPLWYLLGPFEERRPLKAQARTLLGALAVAAAMALAIWLLREHFYLGRPLMPGQVFEEPLPVVANHWHVRHNLRQFLIEDWVSGRAFISLGLCATLLTLSRLIWLEKQVRAALWSLCVIASIIAFGYVNETRHYLMLLAFWFGYAWPPRLDQCAAAPNS